MSQRLGDLLVKEKVITSEQLEQATKAQRRLTVRLGSALVKLGFLTEEDVTNFLSRQYGVPAINLSYFEIDPSVVKLIPFETATLPDSAPEPCGRIADHRHGGPDQRLRHGRYQVHDRLQHRAGGRVRKLGILDGIEKAYGTTRRDLEAVMASMDEVDERRRTAAEKKARWTWPIWRRRPTKLPL